MLRNSSDSYGWVAILVHWIVALTIFGLFGLGLYMVELTYYDEGYRTFPHIHKSIGALLLLVMVFRLVWRLINPKVAPLSSHLGWEVSLAHLVHGALYLLVFIAVVSGYFISTADGNSIEVFNWFEIPSLVSSVDNLEDIAGEIHEYAVWSIMVLVGFHIAGALKHKVIDKDGTLERMLKPKK